MRRLFVVVLVPALVVAIGLVTGAQLAPAAERAELGNNQPATTSSMEFVGRAEQAGASVTEFGYITHLAGVDDAALFSDPNPIARNESTAHISFFATTQISQRFTVLPPPAQPSLIDVDSSGTLTLFFSETPPSRSFAVPGSFASGTVIATNTLRLQDVIAAEAGIDPSRGVVDGNGQLCQQSASSFKLAGETRHLGHQGLLQSFSSHGWTQLTNPSPPQSLTQFGGHTAPIGTCGQTEEST